MRRNDPYLPSEISTTTTMTRLTTTTCPDLKASRHSFVNCEGDTRQLDLHLVHKMMELQSREASILVQKEEQLLAKSLDSASQSSSKEEGPSSDSSSDKVCRVDPLATNAPPNRSQDLGVSNPYVSQTSSHPTERGLYSYEDGHQAANDYYYLSSDLTLPGMALGNYEGENLFHGDPSPLVGHHDPYSSGFQQCPGSSTMSYTQTTTTTTTQYVELVTDPRGFGAGAKKKPISIPKPRSMDRPGSKPLDISGSTKVVKPSRSAKQKASRALKEMINTRQTTVKSTHHVEAGGGSQHLSDLSQQEPAMTREPSDIVDETYVHDRLFGPLMDTARSQVGGKKRKNKFAEKELPSATDVSTTEGFMSCAELETGLADRELLSADPSTELTEKTPATHSSQQQKRKLKSQSTTQWKTVTGGRSAQAQPVKTGNISCTVVSSCSGVPRRDEKNESTANAQKIGSSKLSASKTDDFKVKGAITEKTAKSTALSVKAGSSKKKRSDNTDDEFDLILENWKATNDQVGGKKVKHSAGHPASVKRDGIKVAAAIKSYLLESTKAAAEGNVQRRLAKLQECFERYFAPPMVDTPEGAAHRNLMETVPPTLRAEFLVNFGEVYCDLSDWERAMEFQKDALSLIASSPPSSSVVECTSNHLIELKAHLIMGRCLETLVQPTTALTALQNALLLARDLKERGSEAKALSHLGTVFELLGRFPEAFNSYDAALQLAERVKDKRLVCEIKVSLGVALLSLGELSRAEDILEANVSHARAIKDPQLFSRVLNNLAYLHVLNDQMDRAREVQQVEYKVAEKAGDALMMAQAVGSVGGTHKLSGQYPEALGCYTKELAHILKAEYKQRLPECYSNIGSTQRLIGQLDRARSTHSKEIEIAQELGETVYVARGFCNLADVERVAGNFELAIAKYLQSLELVQDVLRAHASSVSSSSNSHLVKVTCIEIEWKAIDGMERTYFKWITEGVAKEDKVCLSWQQADRKHLSILSDELRKREESPSSLVDQDFIRNACSLTGFSLIVEYSFLWEDTNDAFVYVISKSRGPSMVKFTISDEALFVLAAQRSSYRMRLVGAEFDTPLLPHFLTQRAEKISSQFDEERLNYLQTIDGALQTLSSCFLAPIREFLTDEALWQTDSPPHQVPSMCFITDGLLSNIPFHALPTPGDATSSTLLEHAAVSALPSADTLWWLVKERNAKDSARAPSREGKSKWESVSPVCFSGTQHDELRTKFQQILHSSAANGSFVDLQLPSSFDVRDEYGGALSLPMMNSDADPWQTNPIPFLPQVHKDAFNPSSNCPVVALSEDIVKLCCPSLKTATSLSDGDLSRIPLLLISGFPSYVSRVIHETYIVVPRALLVTGIPAHVTTLWKGSAAGMDSSSSSSTLKFKNFISSTYDGRDALNAYRQALLKLKKEAECGQADDDWQRFVFSGLPLSA